ncbi:MAG: hypothetical protein KDD62_02115 [Bdellovibrionales bacterium]|nr:hypothetical protein [Bdellovibrionales bacterium]
MRRTWEFNDQYTVRASYFVSFTLALCWVCMQRYNWLAGMDIFPSTDAYYYLTEFKARLSETALPHYERASLFFTLASFVGRVLGLTPEALYIGVFGVGYGALSVSLLRFVMVHRCPFWGMASLFLLFESDTIFYRQFAFLAQGFSMSLWGSGVLLIESEKRVAIKRIGFLVLCCASLLHLFTLCLTVVYFLFRWRSKSWWSLAIRVGVLLIGAAGLESFSNRAIFASTDFSWGWGLYDACIFRQCSFREWADALLFSLTILLLLVPRHALTRGALVLSGIVVLLNLPIWTVGGHMSYRLALSSAWIGFMLILMLGAREHVMNWRQRLGLVTGSVVFALLCLVTAPTQYGAPSGPVLDIRRHATTLLEWLPPRSVLVAKHGLQYQAAYFLERYATSDLSEAAQSGAVVTLRPSSRVDRRKCPAITDKAYRSSTCISLPSGWLLEILPNNFPMSESSA